MRFYLISYDLIEVFKKGMEQDWAALAAELPAEMASLIQLPILKDVGGCYLYGTEEHAGILEKDWKERENTRSWYEWAQNKINAWDYIPGGGEEYEQMGANLERCSEAFLKWGLFFSLLLARKLGEIREDRFIILFNFSIFRNASSNVFFHAIRENEITSDNDDFENKPTIEGLIVIET